MSSILTSSHTVSTLVGKQGDEQMEGNVLLPLTLGIKVGEDTWI